MKNPFELHTPSVFVINSPFQALCTVAAIRQLQILQYKVIVTISTKNPRYGQLKSVLENFKIPFNQDVYKAKDFFKKIGAFIPHISCYKRLFIGDFRYIDKLYIGARYVSNSSHVVHIDDGSVSIAFFKGVSSFKAKKNELVAYNLFRILRKLKVHKNFLTIYTDIPNHNYNIEPLSLTTVSPLQLKQKRGIYIVGTNSNEYCKGLNIKRQTFLQKLEELIIYLQEDSSGNDIIYIPHGRDDSFDIQMLCKQHQIHYCKPHSPIELFLCTQEFSPLSIWGFTSSALYNLKKIYPSSKVVNIVYCSPLGGAALDTYLSISEYYEQNGIELHKKYLKNE